MDANFVISLTISFIKSKMHLSRKMVNSVYCTAVEQQFILYISIIVLWTQRQFLFSLITQNLKLLKKFAKFRVFNYLLAL